MPAVDALYWLSGMAVAAKKLLIPVFDQGEDCTGFAVTKQHQRLTVNFIGVGLADGAEEEVFALLVGAEHTGRSGVGNVEFAVGCGGVFAHQAVAAADTRYAAQTRQSLTNLGYILEQEGYTFADVAKTTVLLQSIADFGAMNGVYAEFFTKDMPARVCYEVAKLPMGALVEIDAVAVK